MEEMTLEEAKQLLTFYKQRSSDLELQVLAMQLKLNKATLQTEAAESSKAVKSK